MTDMVVAKFIEMFDGVILNNKALGDSYTKFEEILKREEQAISEHNIDIYMKIASEKEAVAANILDSYKELSSSCEDICDYAQINHLPIPDLNKLSDINSVLDIVKEKLEIDELSRKILAQQVEKVRDSINHVLEIQVNARDFVQRNVILVNKLLENHRNSYQFWREAIATEAVGYNAKGFRNSKQSVSMFNARA